jgi:hypothetical protein
LLEQIGDQFAIIYPQMAAVTEQRAKQSDRTFRPLRRADIARLDESVGGLDPSVGSITQVTLGPPGEIGHDHAKDAARTQQPKGVRERPRDVLPV